MNKIFSTYIATLLGLVLPSAVAEAQSIPAQRCAAESLNVAAAEARIAWARRCALIMRVGDPEGYDPSSPPFYEYTEYDLALNPWGTNSYIGPSQGYSINYTSHNLLFRAGPISVGRDPFGYYYWTSVRRWPRPLYPSYGSLYDIFSPNNEQLFPHPLNLNDCGLYLDKAGTIPAVGRAFYVNLYCEAL